MLLLLILHVKDRFFKLWDRIHAPSFISVDPGIPCFSLGLILGGDPLKFLSLLDDLSLLRRVDGFLILEA